jgi:predicted RNA-binding protein with RPS1 domain
LHCSANERRADEASRDVEAWLKCKYMREHLGEDFSGTVSAVTTFGVFVTLDAMFVEGLIHITELGGDYFRFDEVRQELRGERTGIRYAIGARVRVQVSRVDLDGRKIDFRWVQDGLSEHADTTIRKNKPRPKSDGTKDGKFWARVEKSPDGCWSWIGSTTTDAGYAQMLWEGRPQLAHRIAWQMQYGETLQDAFLMNVCGQRACVNPEHWELKKKEERPCMTANCDGISIKKLVDGYCERCERRRRTEYRKTRPNPYACINPKCKNPSGTVAFASLCQRCRRKEKLK